MVARLIDLGGNLQQSRVTVGSLANPKVSHSEPTIPAD